MFAPLLIVALVASAQAFPGSDPPSETLAVAAAPQYNGLRTNLGNPATCLMTTVLEIKSAIDALNKKIVPVAKDIFTELQSKLAQCPSSEDKLDCVSQAVRDTWESNEAKRAELLVEAGKVMKAVKDVVGCFQSEKRQLADEPLRFQTLPRHLVH